MKAAIMSWSEGHGWTGPEEPRAGSADLVLDFSGALNAISGIGQLHNRTMTITALSGKAA